MGIVDEELRKIKTNVLDPKLSIWEDLSFFQDQEPDVRLDNNYFSASYEKALHVLKELDSKEYEVKSLEGIMGKFFIGIDPMNLKPDDEDAIPLIEGKNVMPNVILPYFEKFAKVADDDKRLIAQDDILLTKDGSPGVLSVVGKGLVDALGEEFGYTKIAIAEHVYKIELKGEYKKFASFIATFLNSKLGQAIVRRYFSGSVSSTLRRDTVGRILVILPKSAELVDEAGERIANLQRQAIDYSKYVDISNEFVRRIFGREVELPKIPINWMPGGKDAHGYYKD